MRNGSLELSMLDKFTLLALDDESGSFVMEATMYHYGMAGAVLYDLLSKGHINIEGKKVKLLSTEKLGDEVLDYCMEFMSKSKKERSLQYWLGYIAHRFNSIKKLVLKKLTAQGILREQEGKVLWIFNTTKYPTRNPMPENTIRRRLHDIVVNQVEPDLDEIMLVSLVNSSNLNKEVYGKDIAKAKAKEIKRLVKEYVYPTEMGKILKQQQDMINALVFSSVTSVVIVTP